MFICRRRERRRKQKLLGKPTLRGSLQRGRLPQMIWNKLLFYPSLCNLILRGTLLGEKGAEDDME